MCSGLEVDGIYRVSGNLAVIQKLRHKADHGDAGGPGGLGGPDGPSGPGDPGDPGGPDGPDGLPLSLFLFHLNPCVVLVEEHLDLDDGQWEEIHVITGALKLFLRELPEPLFPFSCFDKFIAAIRK